MSYSRNPGARARVPSRSVVLVLCASGLGAAGAAAQASPCPPNAPSPPLRGLVQDAEGAVPLPGARILARWNGGTAETTSDADGAYAVCGVPLGVPLFLQAAIPPYRGLGVPTESEDGAFPQVVLRIDFATDAVGQVTGRVVGRVVDRETGEPVPSALVGTTERGYTSITDQAGRFRLDDLFPMRHTLKVRHLAYGENETELDLATSETFEVEIQLAAAVLAVAPIHVRIVGTRSRKLELSGFYERRDWNEKLGLGHYLTRREIGLRGPSRVSHLLTTIPRVDILRGGCIGPRCTIPYIRGSPSRCRRLKYEGPEGLIGASVYVDGHRTRTVAGGELWGVDELMMPSDIAGVEVYSGMGDLPGEFADTNAQRCGAIVIWTGA